MDNSRKQKNTQQPFFTAQFKIKSFSPIYVLKFILYLKKTLTFLVPGFIFLPKKNKEIVVLRSPFVYKSSRLKFKFTTYAALFYLKFFTANNVNLTFVLDNQVSQLAAAHFSPAATFYSCKKKYQNYYF